MLLLVNGSLAMTGVAVATQRMMNARVREMRFKFFTNLWLAAAMPSVFASQSPNRRSKRDRLTRKLLAEITLFASQTFALGLQRTSPVDVLRLSSRRA